MFVSKITQSYELLLMKFSESDHEMLIMGQQKDDWILVKGLWSQSNYVMQPYISIAYGVVLF